MTPPPRVGSPRRRIASMCAQGRGRRSSTIRTETAGARPSPDDDVAELEVLRERGILSDEEFKHAKQKALAA